MRCRAGPSPLPELRELDVSYCKLEEGHVGQLVTQATWLQVLGRERGAREREGCRGGVGCGGST